MKFEDLDEVLLELEMCRKHKDVREYLQQEYNLIQNFKEMDLL
jgi:hypothetical protein